MSILTAAVTLVILLSVAWAVLEGLVRAVGLLQRPPGDQARVGASVVRDIVSVIIVGLGGLLIGSILVTAALVAEHEPQLIPLQSTLIWIEHGFSHAYETGTAYVEKDLVRRAGASDSVRGVTT